MGTEAPGIIRARHHRVVRLKNKCHPNAGMVAHFVEDLNLFILKCHTCGVEQVRAQLAKEFYRETEDDTKDRGHIIIGS